MDFHFLGTFWQPTSDEHMSFTRWLSILRDSLGGNVGFGLSTLTGLCRCFEWPLLLITLFAFFPFYPSFSGLFLLPKFLFVLIPYLMCAVSVHVDMCRLY